MQGSLGVVCKLRIISKMGLVPRQMYLHLVLFWI